MVIYLYLVILIVICVITGIITTIVEHKRLIPKKKKSLIRVIEAPKLVYQSIDSHISKETNIISIIDNNAMAKADMLNEHTKMMSQVEVNNNIEVLDDSKASNVEELI